MGSERSPDAAALPEGAWSELPWFGQLAAKLGLEAEKGSASPLREFIAALPQASLVGPRDEGASPSHVFKLMDTHKWCTMVMAMILMVTVTVSYCDTSTGGHVQNSAHDRAWLCHPVSQLLEVSCYTRKKWRGHTCGCVTPIWGSSTFGSPRSFRHTHSCFDARGSCMYCGNSRYGATVLLHTCAPTRSLAYMPGYCRSW